MNRCKDCKWWDKDSIEHELEELRKERGVTASEWGECDKAYQSRLMKASYDTGCSASFLTSAEFGCVQFERRENEGGQ